jgi:hypothetical protein
MRIPGKGRSSKDKLVFILVLLVTGCASNQYPVTFASNPSAAAVICQGQLMGYSPVTLYYPTERIGSDGALQIAQCYAKWTSGAERAYLTYIDTSSFPNGLMSTAPRPDVPGYETDARIAFEADQNARARTYQARPQNAYQPTHKSTDCMKIGTQTFCDEY